MTLFASARVNMRTAIQRLRNPGKANHPDEDTLIALSGAVVTGMSATGNRIYLQEPAGAS